MPTFVLINKAWDWFKHAPSKVIFSRMIGAFTVAVLLSLTKELFLIGMGFSILFLSILSTMLKIVFFDIDMFNERKHGPFLFRAIARIFFLLLLSGMLFIIGTLLTWLWEASEIV